MRVAGRTFTATALAVLLAALGITAAIAADQAPDGPPKIAFLANGDVPADALAAGPIAGQLGAPLYTTPQDNLAGSAEAALRTYDPELVIVLGGPVAISDDVIDQVEAATGLAETSDVTPAGGVVRAAGGDRFETAAVVADLLTAYDPAYLPVGSAAVDADTLDGIDSSQFARQDALGAGGGDADTLDGNDSADFLAADGKAADAAHADDADTLDGKDSTSFAGGDALPLLVVRQPGNSGMLTMDTETEVLTTDFTPPSDGLLDINSSIFLKHSGSYSAQVDITMDVDGVTQASTSQVLGAYNGANHEDTVTFPRTIEVTGGQTYTLSLSVLASSPSSVLSYRDQRISATFMPASQASWDPSDS